jgi:hypothetical protein
LSREEGKVYGCIKKAVEKKVSALKKAGTDSIIMVSHGYYQGRTSKRTKHVLWKQGGRSYLQSFRDCEPSSVQLLQRVLVDTLFALYLRVEALPSLPITRMHDSHGYSFELYLRGNAGLYSLHDYQRALLASKATVSNDSTHQLDPRLEWLNLIESTIKE